MPRTYINPTTEIEWAQVQDISVAKDGQIRATISGSLVAEDKTAAQVIALIPAQPPSALLGNYASVLYLSDSNASFGDGGIWEITATYNGTETSETNVGDPGGDSDVVYYETRVSSVEEDITTHPAYADYSAEDKAKIAGLIQGEVFANPLYTGTGTGITSWEFVRYEGPTERPIQVTFDDEAAGLTAAEMARRIARGVLTYFRPTIVLTRRYTQQNPKPMEFYNTVATAVVIPQKPAPGDREWFFLGFSESQLSENAYSVTEEYQLSDAGGVDDLLYG